MDGATAAAIFLPALFGIGGVVLGWRLNRASAREAARDEREWSERQRIRIREEEAAARLDERLVEVLGDLPRVAGPAEELAPRIAEVHLRVTQAWQRSTVLMDPEITRRMEALDMAMLIAVQHADTERVRWRTGKAAEPRFNPWTLQVAAREVRMALAAFQRQEEPAPAKFPTATELVRLAHPEGGDVGLDEVYGLLRDRGAGF